MSLRTNHVVLSGYLGSDPESRTVGSDLVVNFSIALNKSEKAEDGTYRDVSVVWIDCAIWNRTAEVCAKNLHKGSKVVVTGRLVPDVYTDQQGIERKKLTITCNHVEFLDSPRTNGQQHSQQQQQARSQQDSGGGYRNR